MIAKISFVSHAEEIAFNIRSGYCKYHVGRHLIFYRQFPEGLEIVRILHDQAVVQLLKQTIG